MPQPSKKKSSNKKGRVIKSAPKSHKTTYIIVGIVAAIVAASAGLYVYSSAHDTKSTTINTTSSTGSDLIYAMIATSQGNMQIELFQNLVPKTVDNFVSLVNAGFYTDLVWHRIAKSSTFWVIQTGDPTTKNGGGNPCTGSPVWGQTSSPDTVPLEISPSLHNDIGYLGIARSSDPNSGSSQFYINLTNNSAALDGQYTVFGKVISGLNVAQAIGNLPTNPACTTSEGGPPENPSQAMLNSITILSGS
jgi:dolichyl-diphosphooligosaccharide--protein glycosyltransferase